MSEEQADYKTRGRTIFRVEKNADNPFVMIDRRPIENPVLSWKAKGILAYLLSRPDNWVVRLGDLVKRSPDGAFTVRGAIKELRDAGHIAYQVDRDENGHIKQWILVVHEVPLLRGNQQVGNQQVGNLTLNDTDSVTDIDSTNISGASLDWKLGHDQEVTQQDLDRAKAIDEAPKMFEKAFGFGSLPWASNQTWEKFRKFVTGIYIQDRLAFGNYVIWRADKDGGKYTGYSNKKIRENPQMFMDTGWPEFSGANGTGKKQDQYEPAQETPEEFERRLKIAAELVGGNNGHNG